MSNSSHLSKLKRLTEKLTHHLDLIDSWFKYVPVLAVIADREKIIEAGGAWGTLGYDPADLKSMEWGSLIHPDDVHVVDAAFNPVQGSAQVRIQDTQGRWHNYEWFYSGTPCEEGGPMCIGGLPVSDLDPTVYGEV